MENKDFFESIVNKVIQGDCLEVMKKIPNNSVDVTFADPPFNLKKKYNSYYDKHEFEEYLFWCKKWLYEMVRVTKPTGSILVHNIPKWLIYLGSYLNEIAIFRHWIAWDAMGSPLGKTLLPNHYGILYYVTSEDFKFYDIRMLHKRCRNCHYILQDYGGKSQMHQFGLLFQMYGRTFTELGTKRRTNTLVNCLYIYWKDYCFLAVMREILCSNLLWELEQPLLQQKIWEENL